MIITFPQKVGCYARKKVKVTSDHQPKYNYLLRSSILLSFPAHLPQFEESTGEKKNKTNIKAQQDLSAARL